MNKDDIRYSAYVNILKRELVKAMGCTEPIAVAYAAAKARATLGDIPDKIVIAASGNIIKNVKSVIVPNSDGRKGIPAAAALGVLGGDEDAELLVIANVTDAVKDELPVYIANTDITVEVLDSESLLDVEITVFKGTSSAMVHIVNEHTNIVCIEKDGEIIYQKDAAADEDSDAQLEAAKEYELLNVADIYDFAVSCDLEDVEEILDAQIACNTAIAEEGLRNDWGACIGKNLLNNNENSTKTKARAMAAAGSDARMSGCEMPVIINSGSGNQGMTASLPVIVYARENNVSRETMLRGLLISNLVTTHAKTGIGRLSAYCGAITAGAGAGAGIAYVCSGELDTISHTIVNALAITSGIVCDGAKPSCAAKIAIAVEAGIMGYEMYKDGQQFYGGDGLVLTGVEASIANFGYLGRVAMSETNKEICNMMVNC
ncbi:MAG: serine dehydratase subunit alpha family protein [Mogibacterium sp.]|nr:serine dehydratase subunit alpha family protein [Mogibacterium sp.]